MPLFPQPQPDPCDRPTRRLYEHWHCVEHGWRMRTRLFKAMAVSDAAAAERGWTARPFLNLQHALYRDWEGALLKGAEPRGARPKGVLNG